METPFPPNGESFEINVDLEGSKYNLTVIPSEMYFVVVLDGTMLSCISHHADDVEQWIQEEGNLTKSAIDNIGNAIESHYM